MDFKSQVLLQLSGEYDFVEAASAFFNEPAAYIKGAISLITAITASALNHYCITNKRWEEVCKIARQCSTLEFTGFFNNNLNIVQKGRGINSEIFGVTLADTVQEIASQTKNRTRTVNFLMASAAPAIMSVIYRVVQENNFDEMGLWGYLQNINTRSEIQNIATR